MGRFENFGYTASVTQDLGENYKVTVIYGSVGVVSARTDEIPGESANDLRESARSESSPGGDAAGFRNLEAHGNAFPRELPMGRLSVRDAGTAVFHRVDTSRARLERDCAAAHARDSARSLANGSDRGTAQSARARLSAVDDARRRTGAAGEHAAQHPRRACVRFSEPNGTPGFSHVSRTWLK